MNLISNNYHTSVTNNKRKTIIGKQNFLNSTRAGNFTSKKNNNTGISRPAQALSFGGSIVSNAQQVAQNIAQSKGASTFGSKIINGITQSKFLNKLIGLTADNEALVKTVYATLIAGVLKPICVMKQKNADPEDRKYIAVKNGTKAFLGGFFGLTLEAGLIKKATDKVLTNLKLMTFDKDTGKLIVDSTEGSETYKTALQIAKETIAKSQNSLFGKNKLQPTVEEKAGELLASAKEHLNIFNNNKEFVQKLKEAAKQNSDTATLYDAFESFLKGSGEIITSILKSKTATILLPIITAGIFATKAASKQQSSTLTNSNAFKADNSTFKAYMNNQNRTNEIAFKGNIGEKAVDGLTNVFENFAMSKFSQKMSAALSSAKLPAWYRKPIARMNTITSVLLTLYETFNTLRSKRIPDSQKLGLVTHGALVTCVSSAAALGVDTVFDFLIDKSKASYKNNLTNTFEAIKENVSTEDATKIIKENCSKLYKSQDIEKSLLEAMSTKDATKQIEQLSATYGKHFSKFKSLIVFATIVRFLVPVLMVPYSAKLKQKIVEKKAQKAQAQQDKKA